MLIVHARWYLQRNSPKETNHRNSNKRPELCCGASSVGCRYHNDDIECIRSEHSHTRSRQHTYPATSAGNDLRKSATKCFGIPRERHTHTDRRRDTNTGTRSRTFVRRLLASANLFGQSHRLILTNTSDQCESIESTTLIKQDRQTDRRTELIIALHTKRPCTNTINRDQKKWMNGVEKNQIAHTQTEQWKCHARTGITWNTLLLRLTSYCI